MPLTFPMLPCELLSIVVFPRVIISSIAFLWCIFVLICIKRQDIIWDFEVYRSKTAFTCSINTYFFPPGTSLFLFVQQFLCQFPFVMHVFNHSWICPSQSDLIQIVTYIVNNKTNCEQGWNQCHLIQFVICRVCWFTFRWMQVIRFTDFDLDLCLSSSSTCYNPHFLSSIYGGGNP